MSWWKRMMGSAPDRESSRSVSYLAEALELEKRGDYSNALTSYRLALRETPDDLTVLQNMAIAFSRTQQPEEAIRSYRKALQIDPELAGAHYGLAYLLLKRGYTAPAAVHLEGFLRNTTDSDAASAKFRAHAQQTLRELQEMGGPGRSEHSSDADAYGDHQNNLNPDSSPGPATNQDLKRPDA